MGVSSIAFVASLRQQSMLATRKEQILWCPGMLTSRKHALLESQAMPERMRQHDLTVLHHKSVKD